MLSSNSKFEWGKTNWGETENGGISGIVFYATTRAEDDPRFAARRTLGAGRTACSGKPVSQ